MLTVEFPAVKKRLPDLVVRLRDDAIFHLELQSTPDSMAWRLLEYYTMIRGVYPEDPLRQMVLYIGPGPKRPASKIEKPNLNFRYTVRDIREIDGQHMLDSPMLEENLLAILCRLGNERLTIREILQRIIPRPARERADALEKRVIPAGLRKLDLPVKKEIKEMVISIDVMENVILRDISEQDRRDEAAAIFRRLLVHRFGDVGEDIHKKSTTPTSPPLKNGAFVSSTPNRSPRCFNSFIRSCPENRFRLLAAIT